MLDTLYKGHPADGTEPAPDTADGLVAALEALPAADAAFAANRWRDLVNVQNLHSDNGFKAYTPGGYRFPIPNNGAYVIRGTTITPFDSGKMPGDPAVKFTIDGQLVPMLDVVKRAIEGVFLPLTESPVIYQFIKTSADVAKKTGRARQQRRAPNATFAYRPIVKICPGLVVARTLPLRRLCDKSATRIVLCLPRLAADRISYNTDDAKASRLLLV